MSRYRCFKSLVLVFLFAFAFLGCSQSSDLGSKKLNSEPVTGSEVATKPETPAQPNKGETITLADGTKALFFGQADVAGKDSFRIEMGETDGHFYFSPTVLIGSPGQTLQLEIVNATGVRHPFNIASPSKSGAVESGGKTTLSVQFPSAGAVTFSCPHTGHAGELRAV